jgi:hypothetical protein
MLYVIETRSGLRFNALAGVIYAGPNRSSDPNESIRTVPSASSAVHSRRRFPRSPRMALYGYVAVPANGIEQGVVDRSIVAPSGQNVERRYSYL